MYWLDFSAARLPARVIRDAGYGGVLRYIDAPDRLRTKHITLDEYHDHLAHGVRVALVFEASTADADGGWNNGVAFAARAKAGADWLDFNGPIFFCNDRTTVTNPAAWRGYLDGAGSIIGPDRLGAYGFGNAMDLAVGHARWFWQAGRRSEVRDHVHIWQDNNFQPTVGGIQTDRNLMLKEIGDDMELTPANLAAIGAASANAVWAQQLSHLAQTDKINPAWVWLVGANMGAWAAVAADQPDVDEKTIAEFLLPGVVAAMPRFDGEQIVALVDQLDDAVAAKFLSLLREKLS